MDLNLLDLNRIADSWQQRMKDAQSTKKANRPAAEAAISALYKALGRSAPAILWTNNPATTPGNWVSDAIPLSIVPVVAGYAWQRIVLFRLGGDRRELELVAARIGYNLQMQQFRMATNWEMMFRTPLRLPLTPRNGRFPWLRTRSNFLTQLEGSALVLWEYCEGQGIPLDRFLNGAAERMRAVLQTTFGAILFLDRCVLIDRPKSISFDGMQLLSSITECALEWRDKKRFFAVDGVFVTPALADAIHELREMPTIDNNSLTNRCLWMLRQMNRPQERVAAIEMLGWDNFLSLTQCVTPHLAISLGRDKFGELWRIECGNQVMMVVKVINHSPEPDGVYRTFVLPVDPELRPLPNPRDPQGRMGEPQMLTALNAVASTFGMTGEKYAAILGKES